MIKKVASRFFKFYCRPEYYDDIQGDLEELYRERLETSSRSRADMEYAIEVLFLLRPSLIRSLSMPEFHVSRGLTQKNIRLALRHMYKNVLSSTVKIFGLSVGIAACVLITLYLQHELTYDTIYSDGDRIYRAVVHYQQKDVRGVDFPTPFSVVLENDFPEIEHAGRYLEAHWIHHVKTAGDANNAYEEGFAYADPELVEILGLPMTYGDPGTALKQPRTILISERKAQAFFYGENPVGKTLILNNDTSAPYQITGVFQNRPSNTHLQFDFLISLSEFELFPGEQHYWGANVYSVYTLLRPGTDAALLSEKMASISTTYFVPSFRDRNFLNPEEMGANMTFFLQPIRDIYLNRDGISDDLPHGDVRLYWLLGISGLLILLIACINFINLSTASANSRGKQIGIQKISGATRGHLLHQFLTESTLFSIISVILGLG